MVDKRRRAVALAAGIALGVTLVACGGGDDDDSSPLEQGDDDPAPRGEKDDVENVCPADTAALLPEGFDPETCWTAPDADEPVFVGETVFALASEPAPAVVAFDVATGAQVWESEPLPSEVTRMAAVEVDGEPGIAVLVTESDEGDAVNEPSQSWSYLAWPGDVDEESPSEPAEHITAPTDDTSFAEVRWSDQGLLAGDQLLRPGADEFEQVNTAPEPMVMGDYDIDESFGGVSGDVLLSYLSGVAWLPDGPDNGESFVGWLARDAAGEAVWDNVISGANEGENALFAEGPARMPVVVGDYALVIAATDETYAEFELAWVDAATGEAAEPTADDLAGAVPVGGVADVIAGEVGTLLSPDGQHLFAWWSTLALVVDVDAGTVQRVSSDFDIVGESIDDTTVYGSTENGSFTIDLATAEATALDAPQESLDAVAGDNGAFTVADDELGGPDSLVVARRS
jgi:hypothetical protein